LPFFVMTTLLPHFLIFSAAPLLFRRRLAGLRRPRIFREAFFLRRLVLAGRADPRRRRRGLVELAGRNSNLKPAARSPLRIPRASAADFARILFML
jgi:hypothetical protein